MKSLGSRPRRMTWRSGWMRLTRIWRRDVDSYIDDELRFHFEEKVAEFASLGMSAGDARSRARCEFGDEARVRESLAEIDGRIAKRARRAEWWEAAAHDSRYVVRSLARSPLFTATVVVTLALGLGANAAIFSVLDRLYLQPPAGIRNADQVRRVYFNSLRTKTHYIRTAFNLPEVRVMREAAPAGLTIAGYETEKQSLDRDANGATSHVTYVEGNYFGVAGNNPSLGRYFSPEESRIEGQSMVAIVSYDLWKRKYNADSAILGKTLEVGSHRHVIVGVASKEFRGFDQSVTDVWVPLNSSGSLRSRKPDWFEAKYRIGTQVVSRVENDNTTSVFAARATEAVRAISRFPDSVSTVYIGNLLAARGGEDSETELAISTRLAGFAAIILCIAIANVVNLLLARASTRKREIALRLALGVSRRRLLLQQAIESGVLAVLSSAVALGFAILGVRTLRTLMMPTVQWSPSIVDARLLTFTIGLAALTGIITCLLPAWQATKPDLSGMLKGGLREGGQRRSKLRSGLVIAQAAFSVVLVAGAGLFVRSLQGVQGIDVGFDADRLAFVNIGFDDEEGNHKSELIARTPEILEMVRRIPGVEGVGRSGFTPMEGMSWTDLFLPGRDSLPPTNGVQQILSTVSPDFFNTVGIRVLRGRHFTESDRSGGELVIAMNEPMAKNLWPGEDPLTKCVIVHKRDEVCRRVVAIVSSAHYDQVVEEPSMMYYLPLAQSGPGGKSRDTEPGPFLPIAVAIRTAPGRAAEVGARVRREVLKSLGDWGRVRASTMEEVLGADLQRWRVGASLFSSAGILALLVAAVGVYSSVAYTISQRTREMGVRVALGANTQNIMRLVMKEGVRTVAVGVLLGLVAALALGRSVASLLYETSPRDPAVLAVSTAVLLIVAIIACSIPAWRASRVDPLNALKAE